MAIALINTHYSGLTHVFQTPEQFDLWSQIVAIVHNHIVLARDFIEAELDRGKTSNASIHRNRCDAGSPKYYPYWAPPFTLPNLEDIPKAALLGSNFPNALASGDSQQATLPQLVSP